MYIGNSISRIIQNVFVETEKCYTKTKTWVVAHRAFAELAASFALNFSLVRFFGNPIFAPNAIKHFIVGSLIQAGKNSFDPESAEKESPPARLSSAFFLGRAGVQTVLHECGHALVALCCFVKANPEISIFPFKGGETSYAISFGETVLGSLMGKEAALVLIAASGLIATTATVLLALKGADQLKKNYPAVAKCLNYQAAAHILIEVDYGRKAFLTSRNDLSHDYIYLWQRGGIHPIIPMFLLMALPMAEYLYLKD